MGMARRPQAAGLPCECMRKDSEGYASRRDQLVAAVIILPSNIAGNIVYGFIAQTMRVSVTDWGQEAAMSLKPEIHHVGSANYRGFFGLS